jgi:hypothetical protein
MTDQKDALLDLSTASNIGFKIVEMADRVRVGDKVMPGARAVWGFTMDGVAYKVTVEVDQGG